MQIYKDYTKEEDFVLWELHQIRKSIAAKSLHPSAINKSAENILKKYNLESLLKKNTLLTSK